MTIAVAQHGRLGNQLFGFATTRALIGPGVPVPIDAISPQRADLELALRPGQTRRLTNRELLSFGRTPRIPDDSTARRFAQSALGRLFQRLRTSPAGARMLGTREFTEGWGGPIRYNPAILDVRGPAILDGFFQNERYFRHRADDVVDALRPPDDRALVTIADLDTRRCGRPLAAVVLRAGSDYVAYGWALRFDWYRAAVRRLASSVGDVHLVVTSDVPLAAEAAAEALSDLAPASAITGLAPVDQLHVLRQCDHAVIANSTFAWWAAWLGDHRDGFDGRRVVVAPDPWIHPDDEIVPDRWIRLPRVDGS